MILKDKIFSFLICLFMDTSLFYTHEHTYALYDVNNVRHYTSYSNILHNDQVLWFG